MIVGFPFLHKKLKQYEAAQVGGGRSLPLPPPACSPRPATGRKLPSPPARAHTPAPPLLLPALQNALPTGKDANGDERFEEVEVDGFQEQARRLLCLPAA
jgi:hypothetical protein